MTAEAVQKFALLIRELTVFANTGAALPGDVLEGLNTIIGSYTNPALPGIAHLEHEIFLGVSDSSLVPILIQNLEFIALRKNFKLTYQSYWYCLRLLSSWKTSPIKFYSLRNCVPDSRRSGATTPT